MKKYWLFMMVWVGAINVSYAESCTKEIDCPGVGKVSAKGHRMGSDCYVEEEKVCSHQQ
jgi:hypothetical protein